MAITLDDVIKFKNAKAGAVLGVAAVSMALISTGAIVAMGETNLEPLKEQPLETAVILAAIPTVVIGVSALVGYAHEKIDERYNETLDRVGTYVDEAIEKYLNAVFAAINNAVERVGDYVVRLVYKDQNPEQK